MRANRLIMAAVLAALSAGVCLAQNQILAPPPFPGNSTTPTTNQKGGPILQEPHTPVKIDGKPAETLTDDQIQNSLSQKFVEVSMSDGDVQVLHLAPGEPCTILFSEAYQQIIGGDDKLFHLDDIEKGVAIKPMVRDVNASEMLQFIFSGGRRISFYCIVAQDYSKALASIRVNIGSSDGSGGDGGVEKASYESMTPEQETGTIANIIDVVANYDALNNENKLDHRTIKRIPLNRRSESMPFTYYDMFVFAHGEVAITFGLRNDTDQTIRYNESKLRIAITDNFVPDFVHIHDTTLGPHQQTTGIAILLDTPFNPNSKFELAWDGNTQ